MYVCVCNAVNDRRVLEAIRANNRTVRELRTHLGFTSWCGRCSQCMRSLIADHCNNPPSSENEPETDHEG